MDNGNEGGIAFGGAPPPPKMSRSKRTLSRFLLTLLVGGPVLLIGALVVAFCVVPEREPTPITQRRGNIEEISRALHWYAGDFCRALHAVNTADPEFVGDSRENSKMPAEAQKQLDRLPPPPDEYREIHDVLVLLLEAIMDWRIADMAERRVDLFERVGDLNGVWRSILDSRRSCGGSAMWTALGEVP